MLNLLSMASTQIISQNPVLKSTKEIQETYYDYLLKYLLLGKWINRKYVKAQLSIYAKLLGVDPEHENEETVAKVADFPFGEYLFFDLCSVLGYNTKLLSSDQMQIVIEQYCADFSMKKRGKNRLQKLVDYICDFDIQVNNTYKVDQEYFDLFMANIFFIKSAPYKILITATMSAGKSTLINALSGKNISLSQNMACTSKIHSIIGKLYDDGFSYEYDHDLVLDAQSAELLDDNDQNALNKIFVGTYFDGILGGERIVLNDTPGVNFSENSEHKMIARNLIKAKDYKLLIYVMNATQLGTNDDDEHLEFVKSIIGRVPVIFVVNKVDVFNNEDYDIRGVLQNQIKYLESKGFENPIVCPVSARAGYLSKKWEREELSRIENRELYAYVDKFQEIDLIRYYKKNYPDIKVRSCKKEEKKLQKTCGLSYIEEIIKMHIMGGKEI